jgi:hypothetical protein
VLVTCDLARTHTPRQQKIVPGSLDFYNICQRIDQYCYYRHKVYSHHHRHTRGKRASSLFCKPVRQPVHTQNFNTTFTIVVLYGGIGFSAQKTNDSIILFVPEVRKVR